MTTDAMTQAPLVGRLFPDASTARMMFDRLGAAAEVTGIVDRYGRGNFRPISKRSPLIWTGGGQ